MDKVCCVFPGQGSQFPGMGKDLYDKYPSARKIFDIGNEILRADLKSDITDLMFDGSEEDFTDLMFDGSEEDLKKTINCQIAILLYSLALFAVLNENKKIDWVLTLGHSIGEYAALVTSKAISLEDAIKLVRIRAGLMKKCIPKEIVEPDTSHMAAVSTYNSKLTYKKTIDLINEACEKGSSYGGLVRIAAKNSKFQTVISGNNNAVIRAVKYLKEKKIKKVIYLPVEGPFHSKLMRPAAEVMKKALKNKIKKTTIPYIANSTGKIMYKSKEIEESLGEQMCGIVRWKESLETAIKIATKEGIKTFIECGPGNVQTKLLKRNPLYKNINVLNVKDYINQISF